MYFESRSFTRHAALAVMSVGLLCNLPQAAFASGQRPTISAPPAQQATVGKPFSYTPSMQDREGDELRVRLNNGPGWLHLDIITGRIYGTPTAAGTYELSYRVFDGSGSTTSKSFTLKVVKASNTAPTISGKPATTVTADSSYDFRPAVKDANGDTLAFSISNKPAWATFSTSSGRLYGKPTASGQFSGVTIKVSDGKASAALPAFAITVTGGNSAPVISGTPTASVNAGGTYTFAPKASDQNNDALTFKIQNKPEWATFDADTGRLSGTPTAEHVGSYGNITIAVNDGKASTTMKPFTVAVVQTSSGNAVLAWTPPTQNIDGSALTNLAGYRVYYGTSATELTQVVQVTNASVSQHLVEDLAPATYYFAVKAYTVAGTESALSNVVSKKVP